MRPWKRATLGIASWFVVLCAASAGVARAQAPERPIDPNRRVFIDVNQVLPVEVLRDVAPVIGARLELSPDVPETLVTLRVWNVRAGTALDAVCDMIGCRWRIDGRVLLIDPAQPPPAPYPVAEFYGRLKKRLEGDQWNFVNAPLRDIIAALTKELRAQVDIDGADLDGRLTVDLRGQTPLGAASDVGKALGREVRRIAISGGPNESDGVLFLRLSVSPPSRSEPPKSIASAGATRTEPIYKPDDPGVKPPVLLSQRKPTYTAEAMRANIQGTVVLSAVVGLDGEVTQIDVLTSLEPELDAQAIEAARQWRFKPGTKDGNPVRVRVTLEMTFSRR